MYSFFLDICQLRLDFDNFDITETTAGVCTDSLGFTTPSSQNPQDLCGTLTGLHRKPQFFNSPQELTFLDVLLVVSQGWKFLSNLQKVSYLTVI